MANPNDNAFPITGADGYPHSGLSQREYLAALAMQGYLACEDLVLEPHLVAQRAVQYADALLAELAKPAAEEDQP